MTPRRQWRPGQLARCRCAPPIDAEPVRVEHGGYVPTLVGGHECPTAVIVRRPTGPRPQGLEQITARIPVELAVLTHAPRRESLLRLRRVRHPRTGEVVEVDLLTRIDELRWADVAAAGGLRAGVDAVFEAASHRLGDGVLGQWAEDHRQIATAPAWLPPIPGVVALVTPAALVAEGIELSHCVGLYVPAVARGDATILSLWTPDGARSTVEVTRGGGVRQHVGEYNSAPPPRHRMLVAEIVAIARREAAAPDPRSRQREARRGAESRAVDLSLSAG